MSNALKIESILGLVANNNRRRASRDGREFEGVLPAPAWTEVMVKRNGTVQETVAEMKKIIRAYAWQTAKLAPLLKGKDLYETCRNIWEFLFTHIKYKEDDEGEEQLRTPARSWAERLTRGIDCDDFTIFAGCILYNLGIPDYIRIARYAGKDYYQHVYATVPYKPDQYITIDAVLSEYDAEKEPAETKDFLIMNTTNLNGVDISVLGSITDDELNEISGVLTGIDFHDDENLQGTLGRERDLMNLKNHLIRTRRVVANYPHLVKEVENPQTFLGMVDYALKYWDTDKRDDALSVLSAEEDRINELEGLGAVPEGYEDIQLFYGLNGSGSYDLLGKAKAVKKFFSKVKEAAKKAGTAVKTAATKAGAAVKTAATKVVKAVVKYNPVSLAARAGLLLAMKTNLLQVASKLKWGYLTEAEAQAHGFDMNEWRKLRTQLTNVENLFVKDLQGNAANLKNAILTGKAGGLSGTDAGMGIVAAAAATGSTAAAMPFITKILSFLKNIDFKKLLSKINVSKLINSKKAAESSSASESNGEEYAEQPAEESYDTASDSSLPATSENESTEVSTEESGGASENLPEEFNARTSSADGETQEGFFAKAMSWVKENPTTSILIGAGAAFLIYQAVKPKKRSLSGTRRSGKKNRGKAKKNLPKTISGTRRKRRSSRKSNRRGKGGSTKTVKL